MEGKPVSYKKSFFTVLFIFALLVQMMVAEKVVTPRTMLPEKVVSPRMMVPAKKALGCPYYNEYCDAWNWCCPGTVCSDSYSGGTCVDDPWKSCKTRVGDSCGFFDAKCCGKMVCTSTMYGGECQNPTSYAAYTSTPLELSNPIVGRFYD